MIFLKAGASRLPIIALCLAFAFALPNVAGSPTVPTLTLVAASITAVRNAASYSEVLAPGCWIAIFGTDLAPFANSAPVVPLPRTLAGVSVAVDGKPAPLLYVSPTQINALIPYEVTASDNRRTSLIVTTGQSGSATSTIYINRRAPAIFTRDASGTGLAHAFDGNFRVITRANPGDVIIFYAVGLGPTNPPASTDSGGSTAEPFSRVTDEVEVFLGDQKAEVLFAGLAPGLPGVYQLNVRVPSLWTDRLYIRESRWLSNVAQVPIQAGTNVSRIVTAEFEQTFPAAISWSMPFFGASFRLQLEVRPDAKPFPVAVVGEAGGWFTRVDPANGMWESFVTTPTITSVRGDFSIGPSTRLPLLDFADGCTPFPGDVIPAVRLNGNEWRFMTYTLTPPSVVLPGTWAGMHTQFGPIPGNAAGFIATAAFGDYLTIPCGTDKTRRTQFTIYVDGRSVTTREVIAPIAGR